MLGNYYTFVLFIWKTSNIWVIWVDEIMYVWTTYATATKHAVRKYTVYHKRVSSFVAPSPIYLKIYKMKTSGTIKDDKNRW